MSIRLMLADDHRMLREGLRRSMTDQGFEVVGEAGDGDEAVRLADSLRPDVVLMDLRMPVMDGYEAVTAIRRLNHPDAAVIPIFALTADAFEGDAQKCMDTGMNGCLTKPVDMKKIMEALYQTL